jgi:trigger factor
MVDAEYQNIIGQLRHEASHEADPKAALAEIEKDAPEYRKIAERRVRLGLLLSEIGSANGVEVSDQEMNRLIANAAAQYQGKDRERFLQYLQQEPMVAAQLRAPLYEDKVVDFLFSKAKIDDQTASREQLEADLESEQGHVHGPGCGHEHLAPAKPAKAKKGAAKKADKAAVAEAPAKGPVDKAPAKPKAAKPLKDAPAAKAPETKAPEAKTKKPPAAKAESKSAAKAKAEAKPSAKPAPSKAAKKATKKA